MKAGMFTYMLKMYTNSDNAVSERAASKRTKVIEELSSILYAPHLIVNCATTPSMLTDGLSLDFVKSGNMSRFMLYDADIYTQQRLRTIEKLVVPERVIESMIRIAKVDITTKFIGQPQCRLRTPRTVEFPEEIIDLAYKESLKDDRRGGEFKAIWNRRVPNAKKLAMIEAVAENPENPVITVEMWERGLCFAQASCEYVSELFTNYVSESPSHAAEKAILAIAKKHKGKYIKRAVLVNNHFCRKMEKNQLRSVLDHLVWNGDLEKKLTNTSGKGRTGELFKYIGAHSVSGDMQEVDSDDS